MRDCDVCHGSKTIRLPKAMRLRAGGFREHDSIPSDMAGTEALELSYHEFPCPQCVEQIPFSRLRVMKEVSGSFNRVVSQLEEEQVTEALRRQAAHRMVDRLLRDNLITVERVETDHGHQFRCTLGVVAPNHVATLEERVAERQLEVAEQLVSATTAEINNWGSYYHGQHGGSVGKWQAIEWLQTALKKVKEKYSATRR